MELKKGDQVYYRLLPYTVPCPATVILSDTNDLILRIEGDPVDIAPGSSLVVSLEDDDLDHYAEVLKKENNTLYLKRIQSGTRAYFRVDDALPMTDRKVEPASSSIKSRVLSAYHPDELYLETPDATVNPKVWRMLADINGKLTLILEHLRLDGEGLARAASRPVNISASGIRFSTVEKYEVGDLLEIKILLPLEQPTGIVAYGNIVRIDALQDGRARMSLHFTEADNAVIEAIIQYTLRRQREIIREKKCREAGT